MCALRFILIWLVPVFLFWPTAGVAGPVPANAPPVDRYGDPLPEHAVARLGTVRLRHSDTVNSVAFSPDGKLLASAGDDLVVVLWDVETGKQVRALPHPHPVLAVLFTPDGKTLVSAGRFQRGEGRVHLWDVASGKERGAPQMPSPGFLARVILSADGKTLITSSSLRPTICWELSTGRELWRTQATGDWYTCLAVAPDSKLLAAGSEKGELCLRDMRTGTTARMLQTVQDRMPGFRRGFSPWRFPPTGRPWLSRSRAGC
jgi:WD40 repeat protein